MITIGCKNAKFTNIKAILFDKDGTLENSQTFLRELGVKRARLIDAQIPGIGEPLLMAFGIQDDTLNPTGLMAVGSRQENEIAAAAYIAETGRSWFESKEIARNAFEEANKYLTRTAESSPLFTGSLEVLEYFANAGLKLGILSADLTAGVEAFVERHRLRAYIQLTMGADLGSKPDPTFFIRACQALDVEPAHTLMIGDARDDIEMAKAAGAAGTIGICWEASQSERLAEADVAIAQLDEIKILAT
ncbi:HAD family hydrolase [Pleurocapsales cyanobacterium LEGE 06147]|nr:HAD family hydrolase [Pleurocapsales cyanobacterium LEGE 06147]